MDRRVQDTNIVPPTAPCDASRWEGLFARFAERLLIYIVHRMGRLERRYVGEDVLHEAFLAAYKSAQALPSDDVSIYRWLRTIADRRMVDLLRAMGADKRGAGKEAVPIDMGDSRWQARVRGTVARPWRREPTTPSGVAIRREEFERALRALDDLDPELMQVFFLRWYEGLTVDEIAARFELSPQAVYKRLARAGRKIAESMHGDTSWTMTPRSSSAD